MKINFSTTDKVSARKSENNICFIIWKLLFTY